MGEAEHLVGLNDLPENLLIEILACLPVELVYRYRIVCKEWNALLSSHYFLTRKWPEVPMNNKPWLILWDPSPKMPCMAFCFRTWTWKPCFSLSFLNETILHDISETNVEFNCRGSAAGLVLLDFPIFVDRLSRNRNLHHGGVAAMVCNPYKRTFIKLDPMSIIMDAIAKCIVVYDKYSPYTVVALGWGCRRTYGNIKFVEFYDGSQRSWEVAGYLPANINLLAAPDLNVIVEEHRSMVYCDGSFYILGHLQLGMPLGILGFSMPLKGEGSPTTPIPLFFAAFPEELSSFRLAYPRLLACGSRLLVYGAMDVPVRDRAIVIWEFENNHRFLNSSPWKWKEIARMPPSICRDFRVKISYDFDRRFDCMGVGDRVCFIPAHTVNTPLIDVLVYDLNRGLWSWLPESPSNLVRGKRYGEFHSRTKGLAFQPTLPMKL